MDLVEVAPQAQPPVARIMDYGKFKFESIKKEKDGRRKHNVIKVKEMKLRPKIGEHDFQTKFHAVKSFLEEGDKVKLTIMFRGREMVHQDIGKRLLERMALELKPISTVERAISWMISSGSNFGRKIIEARANSVTLLATNNPWV